MKLSTLLSSSLALSSVILSALGQRTPQSIKLEQLSRANNGIINIDSALYDEITQNPRDYSVSIVLTAMGPQYKCQPCQSVTRSPTWTLARPDVLLLTSTNWSQDDGTRVRRSCKVMAVEQGQEYPLLRSARL